MGEGDSGVSQQDVLSVLSRAKKSCARGAVVVIVGVHKCVYQLTSRRRS